MTSPTSPSAVSAAAVISLAVVGLMLPLTASAQERARRVVIGAGVDFVIRGQYGGDIAAEEVGTGCVGFVSAVPDVILEVDSGMWLHLQTDVLDGSDTTLVLRTPDDTAVCNDNADPLTVDPEIVTYIRRGEYHVHFGAKEPLTEGPFRLRISEAREEDFPIVPAQGRLVLQGRSGGAFEAGDRAPSCVGAIAGRPNHVLRVAQPNLLVISAESSSDLTLVIVTSSGDVYCSDDAVGTLDPQVAHEFSEGLIRIYVGSHNPNVNAYYTLTVQPLISG